MLLYWFMFLLCCFFFFKQKTAYEMRIMDWSSDVCSSDLDDLVNEGGIMDLWVREARLFKYGSGTGSNFSKLRGENEPLAGGGKSSGLMSFLKIGDRAAGAIKSGGTARRAAKTVTGHGRASCREGVCQYG